MGISVCLGYVKGENNNERNTDWIVMKQNIKHVREKKPNISANFMFRL